MVLVELKFGVINLEHLIRFSKEESSEFSKEPCPSIQFKFVGGYSPEWIYNSEKEREKDWKKLTKYLNK